MTGSLCVGGAASRVYGVKGALLWWQLSVDCAPSRKLRSNRASMLRAPCVLRRQCPSELDYRMEVGTLETSVALRFTSTCNSTVDFVDSAQSR
jgi:hypothetical protein